MSWYELGMESLRIEHLRKIEQNRSELTIEMTRSFMALYHNHNMVMGKGSQAKMPTDFWKLPYDKEEPEVTKEEKEEQMKAFMEKAKKRIKKNG